MNKRILFIAHDSGPYGGNQSLINIVSSLKEKGVFVVVVFPEIGVICDIFKEKDWDYKIINFRTELCEEYNGFKNSIKNLLRSIYKKAKNSIALKKLNSVVDSNNINIIHSNSSVITIGLDLAKLKNITHVWHLREYIHPNYNLHVLGGLEKYKMEIQKAKNIICITDGIAKHFNVNGKALILHDAIRKQPLYLSPIFKKKYFLFCGAIVVNKGIEEAIDAFHKVFLENLDYKFLIVGTGSLAYEKYLKEKVCSMGMTNYVEFLGFRKDIDVLMGEATAFLMCSRNEALGRVTVEAMMNFCIVFGYNNCGTAEIIKHGTTGFLYNDLDQLVEYMIAIVNDFESFSFVRDNAYRYATNNFIETIFGDKLIEYYNGLI
jgi:glycosyltransferase involved in cell wall biosynthesis